MRIRRKLIRGGTYCFVLITGALLITLAWKEASNQDPNIDEQITSRVIRGLLSDLEQQYDDNPRMRKARESSQRNIVDDVDTITNDTNKSNSLAFVINNEDACLELHRKSLSLLIFVESSVENWHRRQAIRETWGQLQLQKALNYRIVYLLGVSSNENVRDNVTAENYRYGDLVQVNFTESFRNLTLKSIMGFKWATTFCGKSDYVMKTDDDILVHVPNIQIALKTHHRENPELILCHRNRVRTIIRKEMLRTRTIPKSYKKYQVSEREIRGREFPPYCSGLGYVVSSKIATRLYQASLVTPYFFIEDAYITGFCREKARIEIRDHLGFTLKPPITPSQGSCAFRDGRITSQEMGPEEIRNLWAEINTQGFFCPQVIGYIPLNGGTLKN